MNSTSYTASVIFVSNSITTTVESWFITLDILGIICNGLAIILTIIYLSIIVVDKTYHTVRMMLIANICLTGCFCGSVLFSQNIFTLQNDLKQIEYQDSSCIFRGYLIYVSLLLHFYSYILSAIYQYVRIIYPTRLFWKSSRTHMLFIVLAWILAFAFPIPFTVTGEIIYSVDNQICLVPIRFSLSMLYIPNFIYVIPISLILFIYIKLVRYVHEMSKRVTLVNKLHSAQRDLKVVRRILILIQILFISGFPLTLFAFLSFANRTPKYNYRIGFIFVHVSILSAMIALFQYTDLLITSVKNIICVRPSMAIPTMMVNGTSLLENKTFVKRFSENVQCQSVEEFNC
jgi:hypothetical protein